MLSIHRYIFIHFNHFFFWKRSQYVNGTVCAFEFYKSALLISSCWYLLLILLKIIAMNILVITIYDTMVLVATETTPLFSPCGNLLVMCSITMPLLLRPMKLPCITLTWCRPWMPGHWEKPNLEWYSNMWRRGRQQDELAAELPRLCQRAYWSKYSHLGLLNSQPES